ncbi:Flavinator of succinate dehydrogenase-domain-containing protein [Xylariaceae sp. FL0255]|nr:Flavinator of succinate dehydrogenase-domain-containing protein [Xylariaceae sp. FL0255]
MASIVPRALIRRAVAPRALFSVSRNSELRSVMAHGRRTMATVGNAPLQHARPIDPPSNGEMAVGELEGASFKIEPLRRVGEDEKTMRARLVYQSRKRGTLESDLLLSTFADANLPTMTRDQMVQYDLFLDENDWDIYYWATQDEPGSSTNPASPSSPAASSSSSSMSSSSSNTTSSSADTTASTDTSSANYGSGPEVAKATEATSSASTSTSSIPPTSPYAGEWAQTVGTFKPAYRPVPQRWKDSEVLALLRAHVRRRAGEKGGMAFMPALKT